MKIIEWFESHPEQNELDAYLFMQYIKDFPTDWGISDGVLIYNSASYNKYIKKDTKLKRIKGQITYEILKGTGWDKPEKINQSIYVLERLSEPFIFSIRKHKLHYTPVAYFTDLSDIGKYCRYNYYEIKYKKEIYSIPEWRYRSIELIEEYKKVNTIDIYDYIYYPPFKNNKRELDIKETSIDDAIRDRNNVFVEYLNVK